MRADPRRAGLDLGRLAGIVTALQRHIDAKRLPGAVFHVERRGVVAALEGVGVADPQRGTPMRSDSIFRIYSMTKPIVSVALMRWFERARVRLDDPVARYLPEFAASSRLVELDGRQVLVAPARGK